MNPFDLSGPSFLLFYILLSAVVIVAIIYTRRSAEIGQPPKVDLNDPYFIAFLRGGKDETLRVATLSLIERGMLTVNNSMVQTVDGEAIKTVSNRLEQKLLQILVKAGSVTSIFNSPTLESACFFYEDRLTHDGLLPDEKTKALRMKRLLIALSVLLGTGLIKVVVALSRGKYNLTYLIVLMIVVSLIARAYSFPRLTRMGEVFLEDIQSLYAGLKFGKVNPQYGGASTDGLMTAAIFGISALTAYSAYSHYANTLFPRAAQNPNSATSSCGSSCSSGGSSCSSSSGSSCGSSCGGGGGCGGCGS
jgi:uncharacterized protein (TIGR04222 family)